MNHIALRNQNLFCENCGGKYELKNPMLFFNYSDKLKAFSELHNDCEKTWTEPEVNQEESAREKAVWWIANGHVGMSSKTMWNHFMGNKDFKINHPYDPDDFSRCYKLLETVPEWKKRVPELATLSPVWKNLSENWDQLTEMYEQNVKEEWINHKSIGMVHFMGILIKYK